MPRPTRVGALLLCVVAACGGPREPSAPTHYDADAVQQWRAEHEASYRRDFVTIAGLHELRPGPNTAGSAPDSDVVLPGATPERVGMFVLDGSQVRFEPAAGAPVLLREALVSGPIDLRDSRSPATDELVIDDIRLVIHVSGSTRNVRVRDPNGPLARGFRGFTWFPIDAQYNVVGRLIRDPEPQRVTVLNTYGYADEYLTEGVVEFRVLGETLRLRPFTTRPGRLYFVFRDASSGAETYEVARFLYADLAEDDTTVLDFNMAYNPPCAFNRYTTCPIPLRENRLPVKILAGEQAYAGGSPQ